MANEEVTDEQKVSSGGGLASEGEMIEVVELSIEDAISYINSPNCESPVFTVRINSQMYIFRKLNNYKYNEPICAFSYMDCNGFYQTKKSIFEFGITLSPLFIYIYKHSILFI